MAETVRKILNCFSGDPLDNARESKEVVPTRSRPSRIYALVIGINHYIHASPPSLCNLRGAVRDADSMETYLKKYMSVPESRIRNLRNWQATRSAIIGNIRYLSTCKAIRRGDPILIFFAGHGAVASSPPGWTSENGKVQMLLPCDFIPRTTDSLTGQGIPDITISRLLDELSEAKGDNITVIFDCCHSASATRGFQDPSIGIRGIDLTNIEREQYIVLPALDKDILNAAKDGSRAEAKAIGFENSGTTSYVLLAACKAEQKSHESATCGGFFTDALLRVLRANSPEKITYIDLIEGLPHIPYGQSPQCIGEHSDRVLFNAKAPSPRRILYRVSKTAQGTYQLSAGEASGITIGAKFNLYATREIDSPPLAVLIVASTTAFTAKLEPESISSSPEFSIQAYALQILIGEPPDLRISIEGAIRGNASLNGVYDRVIEEMDKSRAMGKRGILPVKIDESPDISLAVEGERVVFRISDAACVAHSITRMYGTVPCDSDAVFPIIASAADFFSRLRRTSKTTVLRNHVEFVCTEVVSGAGSELNSVGSDLIIDGTLNILVDDQKGYGYEIRNKGDIPLYAAVFFFDVSDLSIAEYYIPNKAKDNENVEFSIPPNSVLPIGYGSSSRRPREYFLREGQNIDIGFIKVFLSTDYVDLSNISQPSPFTELRAERPKAFVPVPQWDSILVTVVQRKGRSSSLAVTTV
ncbi:uncharacterized protein STEHIDRAFT_163672 [Stereum hirsutum FP-91666 SS1]|uniref:Peptidase C14 caspase domain-containing protein n=1 Tax=Stereum hirsutum (strain FP-91666) TaxID=721885 RepID=R7RW42_STEHR|nr:uncharacterized protein STEHIDRAFT_163672 [Stereum hirsutum FP-91666 SS1]EIM79484.1 hypothetical protein STEHIDRAFT_163672 [Stereum hirsutum FP-91666 SS1]